MASEVGYKLSKDEHEALLKALEDATRLLNKGRMHQHEWEYHNDSGGCRQTCRSCGETVFTGVSFNA